MCRSSSQHPFAGIEAVWAYVSDGQISGHYFAPNGTARTPILSEGSGIRYRLMKPKKVPQHKNSPVAEKGTVKVWAIIKTKQFQTCRMKNPAKEKIPIIQNCVTQKCIMRKGKSGQYAGMQYIRQCSAFQNKKHPAGLKINIKTLPTGKWKIRRRLNKVI